MDIEDLSTDEKTLLLAGADFWHTRSIPGKVTSMRVSDGPHGLRKQRPGQEGTEPETSYPATCFPTESALACSFDTDLLERVGQALGQESRAQGVNVLLGPGINMKRDPRCGRNFEYFSEDPVLAGTLAAAYIRGVQSQGVGACLKHFAVNSQERKRMVCDSIVDERALHEVYLSAFELAIRNSRPWMLMPAYNRLNGTYCCENADLIALARSWGFDGIVVSDWGAMSDSIASTAAGLSLCMPGPRPDHIVKVREALANGTLSEAQVDRCIAPSLALAERIGAPMMPMADGEDEAEPSPTDEQAASWHTVAQTAAEQSAVLLKNEGDLLPLRPDTRIAIIGAYAEEPRYQGGGSSQVNARTVDTPLKALRAVFPAATYAPGYDARTGEADKDGAVEAVRTAQHSDVAIVFLGQAPDAESEGYDRADISLPNSQIELLRAVHAVNPNIVAILQCGAPVDTRWSENVRSLLLPYLAGEACGTALARLLVGAVNPSGKVAESWPMRLADVPCGESGFPDDNDRVFYRESIYIGYRWYDAAGLEPAFPFGFGLSYTRFTLDQLQVAREGTTVHINLRLTNSGDREGAEVVQAYVAPLDCPVFHAPQQLRAFRKVPLRPEETQPVQLTLGERDFSHYDAAAHRWCVDSGDYEIRVGTSSRDTPLRQVVHIEAPASPHNQPENPSETPTAYNDVHPGGFTDEAFAALLGHPLPAPMRERTPLTIDSPVSDIDQSVVGRLALRIIRWVGTKIAGGGTEATAMLDHMLQEVPLRAGVLEDFIDMSRVEALVKLLNHEGGVIAALRRNYAKRLR